MARTSILEREVRNIIECSLCLRIMNTPKVLPCQHTFCLKCLEEHKVNKNCRHVLPCPMCRTKFLIPAGGLSKLESNFLVSKLIAAQSTLMNEKKKKEPVEHFCDDHPTKVVKFYCRECHNTFCASCYATKHKQHPFSEMSELAEKLKISWKSKFKEIEELMDEITNQLETVEEYETYLAKQIAESETQVIKTGEDIKQLVDLAVYELLNKLNTYKFKCSIKLDTSREELESRSATLQEYIDSHQEIIDSADAFSIVRVTGEMERKADELKSLPIISISKPPDISFVPSDVWSNQLGQPNTIGQLSVYTIRLTFVPQGLTVSNGKLYVLIPRSPDIHVYDTELLEYQRKITVPGMNSPYDIVANKNVLYISEYEDKVIHKISLSKEQVSSDEIEVAKWNVDGTAMKLSISRNGNVIVASSDPNKIMEYTRVGEIVREIVFDAIDSTIVGLQHAIQLDDDRFLICHVDTNLHRVCIIDNTGVVIKSYGGEPGSAVGQMNGPVELVVDMDGNYLVADQHNGRIVRLDRSLEFIEQSFRFEKIKRMRLVDDHQRLYVIVSDAMIITIYDVFVIGMRDIPNFDHESDEETSDGNDYIADDDELI